MLYVRRIVTGPLEENCWIVGDTDKKECAIIDPGYDGDYIVLETASLGFSVKYILLTHAHVDHILALRFVKDRTNAPVYLHKRESFLLKTAPVQAPLFGMKPSIPPSPDYFVDEDTQLEIGSYKIKCILVPGHSPGGTAYIFSDDSNPPMHLFTGDILFAGSVGRTDLPGGNWELLISGIKNKILTLPDDTIVYPGHGPTTTIGREKKTNPFLA